MVQIVHQLCLPEIAENRAWFLDRNERDGNMNRIEFRVQHRVDADIGQSPEVAPVIDGRALSQLVSEFEAAKQFDVVGGYGGIFPGWSRYPPLEAYYLGESGDQYWDGLGKIAVLECDGCGEIGCRPLLVKVTVDTERVTWNQFEQPHRPGRDYSDFGPFVFSKDSYVGAVVNALPAIPREAD